MAQTIGFRTDPETPLLDCGETITVGVQIDGQVRDLRGLSLIITYEEKVLEPITVLPGSVLDEAQVGCGHFFQRIDDTTNDGDILVDAVLLGCSAAGPGEILTIVFRQIGDGRGPSKSPISAIGTLRDSINDEIEFSVVPVTVESLCGRGKGKNDAKKSG